MIFAQPFYFDAQYDPREIQLELVDLLSSMTLKKDFNDVGVIRLYTTHTYDILSCYFKTRKKDGYPLICNYFYLRAIFL